MTHAPDRTTHARDRLLILGATGQIGRALRRLAAGGHWPGAALPVFGSRHGAEPADYRWDLTAAPAPADDRLAQVSAIVLLTRAPTGDPDPAGTEIALAEAALALAAREGIPRVLIASSQAVYGPSPGPHTETGPTAPAAPYGAAKLALERALAGRATFLRIGNVAGTDMLLTNAARGPVTLDEVAPGQSPRRAYIGPRTLAHVFDALAAAPDLPGTLNIAAPGTAPMHALLEAAGLGWTWRPAPAGAIPDLALDLTRLAALVPLDPGLGTPKTLIEEARLGGWSPAA